MTDEHRLLERARQYDPGALGELYDVHARPIYAYLYQRVHDAALAEDLTSEVFVRLVQAFRARQTWHTSLRAWLYRVAHNLVVDYCRRQPAQPILALDDDDSSADDVEGDEDVSEIVLERLTRRQLRAAVRRLTDDQQHVLALRFGQRLTAKQVADVMDKSVSAVEALQHRALQALRRVLDEALSSRSG